MKRLISFCLDQPDLSRIAFVMQRESLPCNGDLECAALNGITDIRRETSNVPIGLVLKRLAQTSRVVVIFRNPDLVLERDLIASIAPALEALGPLGDWALAGAGGLGLSDRRHVALYASQNPSIPEQAGLQPLIDLMPDLYLANAEFLRAIPDDFLSGLDQALEPALATLGYLENRVSVFVPKLVAGINGELLSRDHTRVMAELGTAFADTLNGQTLETLSGPVRLNGAVEDLPGPKAARDLHDATLETINARADIPSISIITRTRFDRLHLLRRMLTSISRARNADMTLEVILSTDAPPEHAADAFGEVQHEFVNLDLHLKRNPPGGHSRVTNLVGGIQVASGEYLMFLDDDDYLDIFAFETIRPATFAGNRPVIALKSDVHEETWEKTPGGRWVLAHAVGMTSYPASGWRDMFRGVNRMPICGMIFSRSRVSERLKAVPLNHDLSEDYALYLLMLTDPELPAIYECHETAVHISIRDSENSVLMPDRRPWARDIARFLADLTEPGRATGAGQWSLHSNSRAPDTSSMEAKSILELQHLVERREQEIRLLRSELHRLRSASAQIVEPAA